MTTREAVVAEARSWIGTRYHDNAGIKIRRDESGNIIDRGGADCVHSVYGIYFACGLVPAITIPHYSPQFMLNRGEEIYLTSVLAHARATDTPLPGDLALFRYGRVFSHGAIVDGTGWPDLLHASSDTGMFMPDRAEFGRLGEARKRFFTLW